MKLFKLSLFLLVLFVLVGCRFENAPKGLMIDDPYFITTETMIIKKITVPKGTKLVYKSDLIYEVGSSNQGKQIQMMDEKLLKSIEFKNGNTIDWGGVPVNEIEIFFNEEMHGFTVYADFGKLSKDKRTKFSELWESCNDGLGIIVKNIDDWSFNLKNITDIQSCSVNYQRYFKENAEEQKFLDSIYIEINKIDLK